MTNQRSLLVYFAACFLLFFAFTDKQLTAQVTTGSVTGSVVDASGGNVPGATVSLTSDATKEVHNGTANATGTFTFPAVQPGSYSLKVEHAGFKSSERHGINVAVMDHVALGDIELQVGAVSETIVVEEHTTQVATDSSQVTGAINSEQLLTLTARGRDVVSLLRVIPGVTYQADQTNAGGTYGTSTPSIGGVSANSNQISVDGVSSNDQGSPSVFSSATMLDAIGEVKVILNSYQAEYTGNGGAIVQVVTKSGGTSYHGSLYEFNRNEDYNANNFFNNRTGVPLGRYRYNTPGGTLGGPIYVPGHWNRQKSKLFGFYNMDIQRIATPGNLTSYTMPSALERTGDFSQTLDLNGKLIPINDPLNGGKQFSGNVIPTSRLNPNGLALINVLPLPNYNNRAVSLGNYNYQIQETLLQPTRAQLFKIDYVPTDKDRFYVRGKTFLSQQEGYSCSSCATPVGFFGQCYCFTESGLALVGTHIFGPKVVLEYNTGVRHNHEAWHPFGENGRTAQQELDLVTRSKIGYNLGQWYPQSNLNGWIPRFSFGGVTNAPNVSYDSRFLGGGTDFSFNLDDAVSITHGNHFIKFGSSYLRAREYEGETSTFSGTFSFAKNTLNPLDTNYAFSNAALGFFDTYSESNHRYGPPLKQWILEWYVQDTWRVTKRLTINAGIRMSWVPESHTPPDGQTAQFALSRYNAGTAPPLFRPVTVNGLRQAQNPVTGALLPAVYIGAFVPGVGNPAPGGVLSSDPTYPQGYVNPWGVLLGPRLGFSWDPFGKGKTAVRGGAAILYTERVSKWGNLSNIPPAVFTPIAYYGNMSTFLQSAGTLGPGSTSGYGIDNKAPDNYQLSFGVQQDLGRSLLLDVSYAGTLGQHIPQSTAINTLPYGARFLPQNQDPTTGKPLPDNFFRPYPGYSSISISNNAFNSNYHSMLLSINRRFTNGLKMGLSYTLSKYLDYSGIPLYQPLRSWSYGYNGSDARNNVVVNYSYDLPKLSRLTNNAFVRLVGDGWSIAGISQFVSGTPASVGFSTVQGTDLTGGGDGQRIQVVGDPNANGSDFYAWFNPAAFALPVGNSPGNASKTSVRNPGVNNNDITAAKRFPIKGEQRYLQFRWEAYNVFNHTQYAGINTAAKYDLTTGAQINALFGQVTSARTPRVMQGVLRLVF